MSPVWRERGCSLGPMLSLMGGRCRSRSVHLDLSRLRCGRGKAISFYLAAPGASRCDSRVNCPAACGAFMTGIRVAVTPT